MALSGHGLNKIASITPAPLIRPKTKTDDLAVDSDDEKLGDSVVGGLSPEKENEPTVPELLGQDFDDPEKIIKSGADAAQYMLSDRDDGDPAVTFRSMVLGTAFAAFYASISQIYKVSHRDQSDWLMAVQTDDCYHRRILHLPHYMVRWAYLGRSHPTRRSLGTGMEEKARRRSRRHNSSPSVHQVLQICQSERFRTQGARGSRYHCELCLQWYRIHRGIHYSEPVLSGQSSDSNARDPRPSIHRTFRVWTHWAVPTHHDRQCRSCLLVPNSSLVAAPEPALVRSADLSENTMVLVRIRFHSIYQLIPGYMFPWLNSVSIPCLASMHATGNKAEILTNIFGGSLNNEVSLAVGVGSRWQKLMRARVSVY